MKKRMSGQVTVEMAIVFPIIVMILWSLIYVLLYVHDVATIKCFAYSQGIQCADESLGKVKSNVKENIDEIKFYVVKTSCNCKDRGSYFEIEIKVEGINTPTWLKAIIGNERLVKKIKIEKNMSKEILYGYRAVSDILETKIE